MNKKVYKVKWSILVETPSTFQWEAKECLKATKEGAVLTVDNLKAAFQDLNYKKDQIKDIMIEEMELT